MKTGGTLFDIRVLDLKRIHDDIERARRDGRRYSP